MNTDTNILNKILPNTIQENIKKIILSYTITKGDLSLEC